MPSYSRFPERTSAAAEVAPVPRKPAVAVPPGAPLVPPEGAPGVVPGPARTPSPSVAEAGPGTREWVLELPAGLKLLSLNDRLHHYEEYRRAQGIKKAAWAMALKTKIPPLERVSIVVEYQPPDKRHRDNENVPAASGKHAIDGIVAAGVIPDDEANRYVTGIRYRIGPVYPKGRLVLHISEAPEAGAPRIGTCHD